MRTLAALLCLTLTVPAAAADVVARIDHSCRQFLGITVAPLGHVPLDHHIIDAAGTAVPVVIQSPTCPAARSLDRIATSLGIAQAVPAATAETP